MAHEVDWSAVFHAAHEGQLIGVLVKMPRARWAAVHPYGGTLLHYACFGPNVAAVVALVQSGLVDLNARNPLAATASFFAASKGQSRVLEALCAAGADVRARNRDGDSPIDHALLRASQDDGETLRVLLANGVRLSTVHGSCRLRITPELEAFERGVLRCRAAVVAMLRVKRASGQLVRWDKFLLVELAVCFWATRCDKGWQK